jgi:hypothetical protein
MRYLLREAAGWLLVVIGLLCFGYCYVLTIEKTVTHDGHVSEGRILYAVLWAVIGIVVFRGGVHLLKVAVAARVCQQAEDRLYPAPPVAAALARQPASPPQRRRVES